MGHIIQNFDALAEDDLRRDALAIAEAGYAAINVGDALRRTLRVTGDTLQVRNKTYSLIDRRILFVGVGKCAFTAAPAIEETLGERLSAGIALDVSNPPQNLKKIEAIVGTHPLPSVENERATARILALLAGCTEHDLVLFLISGGGSALLCSYEPPITFAEECSLFSELTAHGAAIQELNTVRKHLSCARGGGLVRAAYPAEIISLIVSDVPGDELSTIASGPTVRDTSTVADARAVLAHYGIPLTKNITFIETEKDERSFTRTENLLFLSSSTALEAMHSEAARRGYAVTVDDTPYAGEARELAHTFVENLHAAPAKSAFLAAGESTVTNLSGTGCGGRNQEMALAALLLLRPNELILPFASDGHDNTDAAGAIADVRACKHARTQNLTIDDHLANHRSYTFFHATGDALQTGYTGSNVSDLIIALKQ